MEFQSYLSQKYQGHDSFIKNIIIPIFGEDNYDPKYDIELLDSEELRGLAARTGIRSIILCGTIDLDLTPIEVFDITVSDRILMDKNRVGVQAVIHRVMDTYSGAFMIFHYDNDVKWDWRFTFCQMKDKGEFTDNKRYTFLLGPNQSCRTAAQNFQKLADLHENISIKDIVAAFDVEALSKAFFDGYKRHYERFVEFITGKRFVKEGGKFVEKTSHAPHPEYYPAFGSDDKAVRDYTKLLLARIVFLHFLQKKGWLGVPKGGKWGDGDEQFMKHLYERSSGEQKEDFLESVLEPLFFDALNGDRSSSKDVFDTKVVGEVRVPYLNGGLFSKDALDDVAIRYPKEFFGDFLEFLYQYNFTIDENDPNDAQVGIDPEMLGKIFENLLEDNKDKGAFYTPKEIVQYMCQESLIACLETKTGLGEDRLRSFVKDPFVRVTEFTPDEQYAVLGAILNVKICDPAIGSGAFPIGLLNELVRCKEAIYGDDKGRAEIKKEIIRDNIYGVDIEKGAVDIARLRFWLSLIVDEEKPLPLPNLDYKIMQGNSLLEWYDGVDLSHLVDAGDTDVFMSGSLELKDDLAKSLKKYFGEANHTKKKALKEHISETIKKILDVAGVEIPERIDVAENNQFFLWHTWFADVFTQGGFDIVLGNPPYINVQLMSTEEKSIYRSCYKTFFKRCDMFCLFMELGLRILSSSAGVVTMIIPSVVHSNMSYKNLRDLILNNQWLQEVHYTGGDVFNAPTVDTTILICNKRRVGQIKLTNAVDFSNPKTHLVIADYFQKYNNVISVGEDQDNAIVDCLFNPTFDTVDQHYSVFQGVVTGNNPAFIFDSEEEALSNGVDKELLHPLCHGRDIEKYFVRNRERRIIYIDNSVQINAYPKTKEWLLPFKETLETRREVRRGLINWYCLQWPRIKAELDLKEKIIVQNTRNEALKTRLVATLDDCGVYGTQGINFIIPKSQSDSLRFLLGILNSRLINLLFATKFLNLAIKAEYVKQIRLPNTTEEQRTMMETFVDKILVAKKADQHADTSVWEAEIDRLVYDLYGVPEEERK